MKVSKDYLLICESAIQAGDGKISLINLFDEIKGPRLPLAFNRLYIAGRFIFEGEVVKEQKLPIAITAYDPKGKKMNGIDSENTLLLIEPFKGTYKRGILMNLPSIILEEEGGYRFEVKIGGEVAGEVTLLSKLTGAKR